jgi:O-antigen/teichoic acid export membrane protein
MTSSSSSRSSNTMSERSPEPNELERTAVSGSASLMVAHGLTLACGYVVVVLLALLGPERYGDYGIIISVLLAVELAARLGIPQSTSRLIAEGKGDMAKLERTAMTLSAIVYLSAFVVWWFASPFMARIFEIEDGTRLFRLAGIDIPFYGMFSMCQHVLNGHRKFGTESRGMKLYGVLKALGVLFLLAIGLTLEGALIVNIAASVVGLLYFASHMSRGVFAPNLEAAGTILRLAFPVFLTIVGSQALANIDLWCLKWTDVVIPGETVGRYVAATNIARLPGVVHFVMMAVLIPTVSRAASVGDEVALGRVVRGALRFLALLLVPSCALLAARAPELMELVYEDVYGEGSTFLAVLVFRFGLLSTVFMTLVTVQIALDHPYRAALQVLVMVPVGILLTFAMIEARGAEGAAQAAVATLALGVVLAAGALWRRVHPLLRFGTLVRTLVAAGVVGSIPLLYDVHRYVLPFELLALLGLYLVLLFLLRETTPDEVRGMIRHGKGADTE